MSDAAEEPTTQAEVVPADAADVEAEAEAGAGELADAKKKKKKKKKKKASSGGDGGSGGAVAAQGPTGGNAHYGIASCAAGRSAVAKTALEPGTMVLQEPSAGFIITSSNLRKYCSSCCGQMNGKPVSAAPPCALVAYCSVECRERDKACMALEQPALDHLPTVCSATDVDLDLCRLAVHLMAQRLLGTDESKGRWANVLGLVHHVAGQGGLRGREQSPPCHPAWPAVRRASSRSFDIHGKGWWGGVMTALDFVHPTDSTRGSNEACDVMCRRTPPPNALTI